MGACAGVGARQSVLFYTCLHILTTLRRRVLVPGWSCSLVQSCRPTRMSRYVLRFCIVMQTLICLAASSEVCGAPEHPYQRREDTVHDVEVSFLIVASQSTADARPRMHRIDHGWRSFLPSTMFPTIAAGRFRACLILLSSQSYHACALHATLKFDAVARA